MTDMSTASEPQVAEKQSGVLRVLGARTHNLKNIDVEIPHDQLVVITGRSGSGKSSLAFDTIYSEGQRQYVESLSIYSRQFFNQLPRADVDSIHGLQPTLCLDQKSRNTNRRSTVGTITEIYDFIRVLMARVGEVQCYQCGEPIVQHTAQQICARLFELPERTKIMVLAPMASAQFGNHMEALKDIRREGLVRVRVDGDVLDIDDVPALAHSNQHQVEAVTDRIIIREGAESRMLEAIENAVRLSGRGVVICNWLLPIDTSLPGDSILNDEKLDPPQWTQRQFSTQYTCPQCAIKYEEVQPRSLSFNSPAGACTACNGLGMRTEFDASLAVDRNKSIHEGAVLAWEELSKQQRIEWQAAIAPVLEEMGFTVATRLSELSDLQWDQFLNLREKGRLGLFVLFQKEMATTGSEARLETLEQLQSESECSACSGSRLSRQARSIFVGEKHIGEIVDLSIDDAVWFLERLEWQGDHVRIAEPLVKEILHRLFFLQNVGVGYLSLGRSARTLSGGEHQRVRLATSIGSGVTRVCFVLDEPSIGLHPRDNLRLIQVIRGLQEAGNSVIVVEHDEAMIRMADHIIDMGPGAGRHGGKVVAQGDVRSLIEASESATGAFLSGKKRIATNRPRRPVSVNHRIRIVGATGNNLMGLDVDIPLSVFCCVTGVSGSGKSTLINDTLAPAIARQLELVAPTPAPFRELNGTDSIDKLIRVDQRPIGRSPRACPATYTGVFKEFRKMFAATKTAKQLGFGVGRFTFNSKSGWCPDCRGHGVKRISMNFMPDIYSECETCQGKRFNLQTLQVRFGDRTIADVLNLTIDHALEVFDGFGRVSHVLRCLADVGLGYLLLGQSATTLSGGEAQRIKLAAELAKPETGNTLYLLDEPTTGLHFDDIQMLIDVLNRLVDQGNSMVVIEHNLDVIRCADWLIDLGPEGGRGGGCLVGAGTPEEIAQIDASHTGRFLKQASS